jgi:hypothetical protein
MALPDSDTTGDVGLAGDDLDRAAAVGLILDASSGHASGAAASR